MVSKDYLKSWLLIQHVWPFSYTSQRAQITGKCSFFPFHRKGHWLATLFTAIPQNWSELGSGDTDGEPLEQDEVWRHSRYRLGDRGSRDFIQRFKNVVLPFNSIHLILFLYNAFNNRVASRCLTKVCGIPLSSIWKNNYSTVFKSWNFGPKPIFWFWVYLTLSSSSADGSTCGILGKLQ